MYLKQIRWMTVAINSNLSSQKFIYHHHFISQQIWQQCFCQMLFTESAQEQKNKQLLFVVQRQTKETLRGFKIYEALFGKRRGCMSHPFCSLIVLQPNSNSFGVSTNLYSTFCFLTVQPCQSMPAIFLISQVGIL